MPRHAKDKQPRNRERGPLERLLRRADAVGEDAEAAIRKALREVRSEIALLTRETDVGRSAAAREAVFDAARKRLARMRRRLERLTGAAAEYAARQGFDAGLLAAEDIARADGDTLDVHYSKERADEICALVTEGQGGNLAAVFTENMAEKVVDALRSATVSAMRENAVAGGTMKELARTLEEKWLGAAKDGENFQFVDAGGHVWDTRTYVAMNVRTNAMRVYNDSLADTIGRATGSDLVRVSRGGDPHCRLCFPWEGRILSLTGKTRGFPTYEQAREAGCFHPNCVHTLDAVDELLDEDEIALQGAHPVDMGTATPEELDENRYQIDQDRYRRRGMDGEQARLAVDRDNLAAEIRAGLLREDAREIVDGMTDAQVAALCPDGNPPRFEPVKRVRGGTRREPKYEPERWRRGSRGGVVHVSRDATAERIVEVCGVKDAKGETDAKPEKPKDPLAHDPIPEFKTADAGMKYVSDTLGVHCAGFGDFDPAFVRGIAEAVADAKAHIGESDRLKGVWTCSEYYREMLEARKQQYLAIRDLTNADDAFRRKVEKSCEDAAKQDLLRWGVPETMSAYGKAWRGWQSQSLPQFNGIVLNDRLDRMDRTGEVKVGFKAKGCEKPISTIYHELGHIIDYQLNLNRIGGNGKPQNKTLKKIWADPEAVRTGLSRYGAKNSRETVAEAWAEYRMNPNPREIALAIGREIDMLSLQMLGRES